MHWQWYRLACRTGAVSLPLSKTAVRSYNQRRRLKLKQTGEDETNKCKPHRHPQGPINQWSPVFQHEKSVVQHPIVVYLHGLHLRDQCDVVPRGCLHGKTRRQDPRYVLGDGNSARFFFFFFKRGFHG